MGQQNSLHALWYYIDVSIESIPGRWIRYSHSLDGITWSIPFTIARADSTSMELRLPHPSLAVDGSNVYAIWAVDEATHRKYRFSTDSGQTWSSSAFLWAI
jgi:hypothetical protein